MIFDSGRNLLDQAFDYASINIASYSRGEETLATNVRAKPAKTVFDRDALYMSNLNFRFSQIDFLVRSADMPAGFEPQVGDVLIDEKALRYEVIAPASEPCWRWHTPDVMRIHCLRSC